LKLKSKGKGGFMGDNTKRFLQGLPLCAVFALAAAAATLLYHAASDYTTYYSAVKIYSVGWFATCVLSFYCGLLVVPRSLGIIFSFAGLVAFAILCSLYPGTLSNFPLLSRVIQPLPALLFMGAWAAIAAAACRSDKKRVRISSWFWLATFLILLSCWATFHYAQTRLLERRNRHIDEARTKTLLLVEKLQAYKTENGRYPDALADAGLGEEMSALSYRNSRIKYFGHEADFVLTFDDPMLSNQSAFSYDTTKDGWFPDDPQNALADRNTHMFLGFLRQL
jgi:hypothetical protein